LRSGRRPVVKIIAKSLSKLSKNHVLPTPLSGIRDDEILLDEILLMMIMKNFNVHTDVTQKLQSIS
jgi:hypothetical protein